MSAIEKVLEKLSALDDFHLQFRKIWRLPPKIEVLIFNREDLQILIDKSDLIAD